MMQYTYSPDNKLCVMYPALIDALGVSQDTIKKWRQRGHINIVVRGGNGRKALIEVESMKPEIRQRLEEVIGSAKSVGAQLHFQESIVNDSNAKAYFDQARLKNGKPYSTDKRKEYTCNANVLNAIDEAIIRNKKVNRKARGQKMTFWTNLSNAVNQLPSNLFPHSLPGNVRSLQRVYKQYKERGYASILHGGVGNDNRLLITQEIGDWLLAQYCQPTKILTTQLLVMYDARREDKGWPRLSLQAIERYLNQPHVERVWQLARNGKDEYRNRFGHKLSRNRIDWFPNAYWAIDGTKLDWVHYWDNDLKMAAKMKINVMIDVYSEKIIGYSYSETENQTDHFTTLKQAAQVAGVRPYKLIYDNQSGHKSSRMQELYSKVIAQNGGVHHPTRAYEKSNPAEQIFNRLQQQVISTFWFSDKQGVKVRNVNNRPNMDFILANKDRLLDKEQMIKAWELAVKMWNEGKHPTLHESRNACYQHEMPMSESFDMLDMVSTFWLTETKPIKYKADGITLRIAGEAYQFEVYDDNDDICLEFRRYNIGKRFHVRYASDSLDQFVTLIEVDQNGNRTEVAIAKPKRKHQEIPALMKPGDKERYLRDFQVRDRELERDMAEYKALMQRTGITPETLIEEQELAIKMGGYLPKDDRNDLESESVLHRL